MTAYPAWTPAPRPGIIPLYPMSFGVVLGRSFAALRRNPRVLLGFALVVEVLVFLVLVLGVGAATGWAYLRLQNVPEASPDYPVLAAGSVAIVVLIGFALGLVATAVGVIVQGVVAVDVARGAVAEKLRLRQILHRVKPVAWRLVGYALLLGVVMLVGFGAVTAALIALSLAVPIVGIILTLLTIAGGVVVVLWLSTKLSLVASAIVLEGADIRTAVVRSWRLSRTRFWPILGVVVVISLIFGVIAQAISLPLSLLGTLGGSVIAPTGDPAVQAAVTLVGGLVLSEAVSVVVQSVGAVVQATATTILYIDCRMRHEGLDQDLLAYVDRRDAGDVGLPDPFLQGIGRTITRLPPGYGWGMPPQAYAPGAVPAAYVPGAVPQAPAPAAGASAPATPAGAPAPERPAPTAPGPASPPAPTQWAAPGDAPEAASRR